MTTRKAMIGAALLLVGLAGLVPPWRRTLTFGAAAGIQTIDAESLGYRPIWSPPAAAPGGPWNADAVQQGSRVDFTRLLAAWGSLLALAGAAAVLIPERRPAAAGGWVPGSPGFGSARRTG